MRFPSDTASLQRCAFAAPRQLVFDALTRCEALRLWLGPRGSVLQACAVDARPEGGCRLVLRGPDGTDRAARGTVGEVASPGRLVCTFSDERAPRGASAVQATLTLRERQGLTWLAGRADFGTTGARDALHVPARERAARESCDRLTEFLALAQNPTADDEVFVARVLDAPRMRVFGAWTDPARLAAWWGPAGWTASTPPFAPAPGGLHLHGYRAPDGRATWERFHYREIDRPARLVFLHAAAEPSPALGAAQGAPSWPHPVLHTLTLFELGERTLLTLRVRPFEAAAGERAAFGRSRADVRQRLTVAFARLETHLAGR